ncbi:SAM-dependent methyltransferase [Candidatus Kaiserbacteria bacterium]|nr:SAM-dependent methyltransferase [Candidatus Kaiserbacteria bacterium]
MDRITLTTKPSQGYELIDSGLEEKLERFGDVVLSRPDPQALWEKSQPEQWGSAAGKFEREGKDGRWVGELPKEWQVAFGGLQFLIKPTSFKHTGLFPEQLSNWEWMGDCLAKTSFLRRDKHDPNSSEKNFVPAVLNIFGYTGGATLAAAAAGANVTHVDASKTAVAWARENAKLSGLEDKPVRWITEDALTFLKREVKRGTKYDAIIMDPPAFGHGPGGELWKFEENFLELLKLCGELLSEKPLFVLINGYAAGYSPLAFAYNLENFEKKYGGSIEYGDLGLEQKSGRILPAGIFARWKA